jgi:hypothetical protein
MANDYGSNYDYGESPFYKDDDYPAQDAIDYEYMVVDLLLEQFRKPYTPEELFIS